MNNDEAKVTYVTKKHYGEKGNSSAANVELYPICSDCPCKPEDCCNNPDWCIYVDEQ